MSVNKKKGTPPDVSGMSPAKGNHVIHEWKKGCKAMLHVDSTWAANVKGGEKDHIDDHHEAYNLSYGKVIAALDQLAAGTAKVPLAKSKAEAEKLTWKKFVELLPKPLAPPSPSKRDQVEKFNAVYLKLDDVTKSRDISDHHVGSVLDKKVGCSQIDKVDPKKFTRGKRPAVLVLEELNKP